MSSEAKRMKNEPETVIVSDLIEKEIIDGDANRGKEGEEGDINNNNANNNSSNNNNNNNNSNTPIISSFDARKHEVRHEVALPPDMIDTYIPLAEWKSDQEAARSYPFKLDPFQELATRCIDRKESVLVSAHTSAGKTVCAEYAIASALRDKQRVIYTSPIKALSNQKFRELQEIFGDVGLMTGDVSINGTASCLVMTTEILRSMLYRGSEVMREVSWVVFDEIHYMRDKERGVVWEETIILLPDTVKFVFLSATIPNALQFARWIVHIHKQPCHVVYTNYRPTPLQHYLFPTGGDGIHLVVDEAGTFREENFQKALNIFGKSSGGGGGKNGANSGEIILGSATNSSSTGAGRGKKRSPAPGSTSDLYKVVRMILSKNLYPVIVFSFSKRACESNALQMSKLDFNSPEEKQLTRSVFKNAIESLNPEDRSLPQIESILPLLERGIGIHHSGLLPILKEVIEILFQEGLIKVLFATETFSIGLNMPAKTVVFTSVRKFDGKDFRWVSSGEYIQMSGRAGRRGLDDRGIVIMMLDDKMEPAICKEMIKGQADKLNSAFHLTYNMILNLMRVDGLSPDFILERSFFQFQNADSLPQLEAQLAENRKAAQEHEKSTLSSPQEAEAINNYWDIREQLRETRADFRKIIHNPNYALPFLQPGRLVRINDSEGLGDFGWAVIINVHKKSRGGFGPAASAASNAKNDSNTPDSSNTTYYVIDVLGKVAKSKETGLDSIKPSINGPSKPQIFPVELTVLDGISSIRLHLPKDVRPIDAQLVVLKSISEVERRFPDAVPLLDPIVDQGIADPAFKGLCDRMEALERCIIKHALNENPKRLAVLLQFQQERVNLQAQIDELSLRISQARSILQMDELGNRKRLLRRLGYTRPEDTDVIDVKGRVACEISTGDELLLTELIFSAAFTELSVDQINALLSCFVFQEKSGSGKDDDNADGKGNLRMKEELAGPWRIIQEAARRIYAVAQESSLTGDYTESEYLQRLRPELMDVVFAWSRGAPFSKICKMTEVFEGSIIRALRRLDELLRQLAQAAKSIGNSELETKFTDGMAKIRRDIVFANSLYL
jgi:ATP-dependent RNA helicase DOB1